MVRKVVERRSKGHTFFAQDRVTKEAFTVRRVYLDIANAGKDDGLPTSLLREISFLQGLQHPNIA
jgi:serine/threonine protein kinase